MYSKDQLLEQLKSWESGYISPSAQRVMYEARLMIEALSDEVRKLNAKLASAEVEEPDF